MFCESDGYDFEEDTYDFDNNKGDVDKSPLPNNKDNKTQNRDSIPTEQRLMNDLLTHYERSVRPVRNASETVIVRMGLTMTQIFDMVSLDNLFYLLC